MKAAARAASPEEIELKLALPTSDPSGLAKRLSRTPLLARRKATQLHLHNIYYDTPQLLLRQQRVALRLRRLGDAAKPKWLQTLKTAGRNDSALSRRGEWEMPVRTAALSLKQLADTPWSAIDPDGTLFAALAPVFETNFQRTSWLLRRRDGSVVEVALDLGQIVSGDRCSPLCELELELKVGPVTALFEVARQIAQTIAVLPFNVSKAERGYALALGEVDPALRARVLPLASDLALPELAQRVLGEMFSHFTGNLNTLLSSDHPEVVHQARVGWRRFRSAMRLFQPLLAAGAAPYGQALQALLTCLGTLRDIDVARGETLPPLADAYIGGDARRAQCWQAMTLALTQACELQRKTVRYALQEPAVGAGLLATTQWLADLAAPSDAVEAQPEPATSLRRWLKQRIAHLHQQLEQARQQVDQPGQLHRVRILAKRLRYDIEALRHLLPRKRTERWYRQASELQTDLGTTRDVMQAAALVAELDVDRGLIEFLRGLAVGQKS
ncbi:MAG: CHAD domain-containing protein [Rhodoferax sp.]|uniref:CYTH and CHAD domain-containing protein n=1 Tax=Rhodoferax sp. TaxID=50421 RepID=UPI00260566D3|nr:CYTH and CHAD domain-containing protein [Rhodoferax sp.]MDD5336054.1 CHAD domain-containing protein [Rhodoferax sp.]